MSFVYESLDMAVARELFERIAPPSVFSVSPLQIIDRQRDAVLIDLGGRGSEPKERGEPPSHYAMLWKGHRIFFRGYFRTTFSQTDCSKDVELVELRVPVALAGNEAEVRGLSRRH